MTGLPPLPHDNLYKFCAFAGLTILVVVAFAITKLEIAAFRARVELERRGQDFSQSIPKVFPGPTTPEQIVKQIGSIVREVGLDKAGSALQEIELEIKAVFWCGGVASFVAIGLMIYGFRNWRIIQLKQDRLLDLELRNRT